MGPRPGVLATGVWAEREGLRMQIEALTAYGGPLICRHMLVGKTLCNIRARLYVCKLHVKQESKPIKIAADGQGLPTSRCCRLGIEMSSDARCKGGLMETLLGPAARRARLSQRTLACSSKVENQTTGSKRSTATRHHSTARMVTMCGLWQRPQPRRAGNGHVLGGWLITCKRVGL